MPGAKRDTCNFVYDADVDAWRPQPYSAAAGGGDTNVKLVVGALIAITIVSNLVQSKTPVIDVTNYKHALIFIDHGPISTTTPAAGTEYRIEVSSETSVDSGWRDLVTFRSGITVSIPKDLSALPAGTNVVLLATTPGYTPPECVFIKNATLSKSEWAEVVQVDEDVSLTLEDPVTNTQTSSSMYSQAFTFTAKVDLGDVQRLRVYCNNGIGSGGAIAWRARLLAGTI